MRRKCQQAGLLLLGISLILIFTAGNSQSSSGHDWYCPDHEAHMQYEKHRKQYHDYNTDRVIEHLAIIYGDSTLSPEQKKVEATEILKDFSAKVKLGEGD